MKEKKFLVSFWNTTKEWGRKMYIHQFNLNEIIGLAKFSLGTWKLQVKEEVQKKGRYSKCNEEESPFYLLLKRNGRQWYRG
jgi:hypothetical protein